MPAASAINLFYFYANKLIDKSQKILYTWTVAGDGGTHNAWNYTGGPTPKKLGPKQKLGPISLTDWNFFEKGSVA